MLAVFLSTVFGRFTPLPAGLDTTEDLLLEDGSFLLLESGDKLLLEA